MFVVLFIMTFLQLRGFDLSSLAGFFKIGFVRALSTGTILLLAAYPLILLANTITQRLFGTDSSKQNIVELFSGSRTIEQRMVIIVFAVAIAPVVEEFLFRFFLYGVIKRYLGSFLGIITNAAALRGCACTLPFFRTAVRFGNLFHNCLRMERLHSCRDDDAFALQFRDAHRARFPRAYLAMKLREVGEDKLLDQLLPRLPLGKTVVAGAGDDCAVIEIFAGRNFLVLKTDCVVEGVHYERKADPAAVGWKAMMRPLSDFAAMSGRPEFALVTVILRKETTVAWVKKLYRGLTRAATKFGVTIVGGETSSTRGPTAVSVSVSGSVEKKRLVKRSGGKKGDVLFVTGRLGGSIEGST